MNLHSVPSSPDAPDVEQASWGYILRSLRPNRGTPALRHLAGFAGVAAIFAAAGFWTLPGSALGAHVLPLKLALTAFLILAGIAFVQMGQETGRVEVQVDLRREELRAVERMRDGSAKIIAIYPFSAMGEVGMQGGDFVVRCRAGGLLATFPMGRGPERIDLRPDAGTGQAAAPIAAAA